MHLIVSSSSSCCYDYFLYFYHRVGVMFCAVVVNATPKYVEEDMPVEFVQSEQKQIDYVGGNFVSAPPPPGKREGRVSPG